MAAEIDNIFTATARSTWHFLIENGQGCYIPAYQRPYSWDGENISRLFEDVLHGIRQIAQRPNTISFLGTIIAIHDSSYQTVDPIYHPEVAPRVMTIIDGQQRICTVVMSNMVVHDYIRRTAAEFEKKTEEHFLWISRECTQLLSDLKNTYMIDRSSGDDNYRYYPRVIRAYSDAWSRRRGQAKYESPVAKLIWKYIDFTESGNSTQFRFNPIDEAGNLIDRYKLVYSAFRLIQREVRKIYRSNPDQYDFPDLVTATQPDFAKGIWGFPLPEAVSKYVAEESMDTHYERFCQLLRLIIFARYLNFHVAITVVTARNEDDAFDMFEALNTTGEPLTAFETFKPKVIESETLMQYEHSPSYESITKIEGYLNRYGKADRRQRATSEMLVPFALAETGERLQKKLNDQRRYLREKFDGLSELNNIGKNRDFVRSLAGVATFMRYGWDVEQGASPSFEPLTIDDEEALVGFEVLRALKHSITIAPLSRFYQNAVEAMQDAARKQRAEEEFVAAIKATVAFSVLWRGAKGGTENIDSHYRDIMRAGINIKGGRIPPLARRPNGRSGALSLANYKKALCLILEHKGGVSEKGEWVRLVSRTGIYEHSSVLARFLLFCASDEAVPDEVEKGLIKRGRPGCAPMLKLDQWKNDAYFTVEHIAPRSPSTGWESEIFDESQTVHTLGNLTLLPSEANNIIGNKSWKHKRLMYKLLASETPEEFDGIREQLDTDGLVLSKTAGEVLDNAQYLGICKSVALFDELWSLGIIRKRTQRFAELAWDRLAPWLFP